MIVLTGSLARGCFQERTSDVDLLVVVGDDARAIAAAREFADALVGIDTRFDITVVTPGQLAADAWPTPITCLIKPPGRVATKLGGSNDALLHRQDAYEAGIVVLQEERTEIEAVPADLLSRCVEHVFPFIRTRFKNPALMYCRVLWWYEYGSLCSKAEAAAAVGTLLPPRFHDLVASDSESYTGVGAFDLDTDLLLELERFTAQTIRRRTPHRRTPRTGAQGHGRRASGGDRPRECP